MSLDTTGGCLPVSQSMKTLRAKLADYLTSEGWDLARAYTNDLEWWADEIWELRSRWAPPSASAFVTVLVEPQWEGKRLKGQGVWGVGCSAAVHRSRHEAATMGTVTMRASKEEIERFVESLEPLRSV